MSTLPEKKMRDGKTIFQKAILPCFSNFNVAMFLVLFIRLNGRLLILERRVILDSRSFIVAVMRQFLYYKESSTQSRRSTTYIIFLFICSAICTACIKKQKQKS